MGTTMEIHHVRSHANDMKKLDYEKRKTQNRERFGVEVDIGHKHSPEHRKLNPMVQHIYIQTQHTQLSSYDW